ncbi:MAG: hypothetical protein A3F40_02660 [Chlamydiae bacterium RIFCSPHIGHO2_12_FULL_27_8]|nr:MAG: hypothetical protein A3F40_02660 [Chlamydiae bacterium RIFCSPHIGHO2_12_FULL_27_8]OGN66304.1 MAG: hypothetical protein A2888_00430 [Chlamydiae bacterium RIFCSPLOWO2_01_FULL_28_7]
MKTGNEKIKEICDAIKKETLDPAKEKAKEIIENAEIEAENIIRKANEEKDKILKQSNKDLELQKKVFDSSLNMATKQGLELLKNKIEKELFIKNLYETIINESNNSNVIVDIITVILDAVKKDGLDTDVTVYISKNADKEKVNSFILKKAFEKLKNKEIIVGDFDGGVKIKLLDRNLTIDLSSDFLKELLSNYLRSDFREKVFNA